MKMKVEKVVDIDNTNWKTNTVYLLDKNAVYGRRRIWDAEVKCKKVETALRKLAESVPELDWIREMEEDIIECAEPNGKLSLEYDCYTYEVFEDTVYVSAQMWH